MAGTTDMLRPTAVPFSPDLFEMAIASLPMAMVVFNERLEVVWRNPAATELLGEANDLPRVLTGLSAEHRFEDWAGELRQVIGAHRQRRMDIALRAGDRPGETFLSLLIHPLSGCGSSASAGGLLLAEDVTSRIGMERRLAVSERLAAVGKLAARVAHELNNPLDGILRFTNLAIRRVQEAADGKTADYLEQVRGGIVRMSEIISDLLEFSRTTPSGLDQATINKIIEDALSAMRGRAEEGKITIVCSFHEADMPVVRGSNLFQVFCNLAKNAIEAMPEGGTLTVTTRLAGPDLVVVFEDTGVGLPPEAERIFEPFFTTKAPGKGTGLGLAVCKELIERHGGTIAAARRSPKGARMTVTIPLSSFAASSSAKTRAGLGARSTPAANGGPAHD